MKKIILAFCLFFFIFNLKHSDATEFKRIGEITDSDLYAIAVSPLQENLYFAGSDNTLFRKNGKNPWQAVYTVNGYRTKINYIYITPSEMVYVATGSGLLKGSITDSDFKKIYKGTDSKESVVYHIKIKDNTIYIGTANGLFVSKINNINWQKVRILSENIEIYWIEFDSKQPDTAYIATSLGVYRTDDNFKNINKIFSTQNVETAEMEDELLVEETEYYSFLPKILHIDNQKNNKLYLGTSDGFFISNDNGEVWNKVHSSHLTRTDIRNIYQDKTNNNYIYLATDKGFLKLDLDSHTITQIYQGLTTNDIRFIATCSKNDFLLATNKGLFKTNSDFKVIKLSDEYKRCIKYEPIITEVQEAAIRYNDISSEKVERWRNNAKKKAWLPEFSVGADRNVTDLYHWDTTTEASYDAVLRKGDEAIEWDVSFSWDFGDLIWSGDQTTIDVRSRLNTQLRIDVLEEVNRLYFERYRLKLKLLNSPPENPKERLKQELRLREMTARLDSYTGGFFSRRIRELQMADKK